MPRQRHNLTLIMNSPPRREERWEFNSKRLNRKDAKTARSTAPHLYQAMNFLCVFSDLCVLAPWRLKNPPVLPSRWSS